MARKGGQWSDHFERAAGAYNARPHETVHGAPEDVEKQPATEFRVLQDYAKNGEEGHPRLFSRFFGALKSGVTKLQK